MRTVAYLANEFPCAVEPYVVEEIEELRRRGVNVLTCSARRPAASMDTSVRAFAASTLYLQPVRWRLLMRALGMLLLRLPEISDLLARILLRGSESPGRRVRALLHTWLGAYYALLLRKSGVEHIHVHHGYFASWIALVAARLSGLSFSMTLHGSDLLVHPSFLDVKLENCRFCITISEFNRRHILDRYPQTDPEKLLVRRLGVSCGASSAAGRVQRDKGCFMMLAVGRLHPVKDHAFLLRTCHELKKTGLRFLCLIAGEGPERRALEELVAELNLSEEVRLLGHLPRQRLAAYYSACDLVVLTSRSEGIPLVLMEAMSHSRLVLAPAMTGIPELVMDGKTGFLYRPGSMEDFVAQIGTIVSVQSALKPLRQAARQHVLEHFNRQKNLARFADSFLSRLGGEAKAPVHEDSVLQQVQLSV
jgi:glycosyltransferase involved in cell wall biosynthesis